MLQYETAMSLYLQIREKAKNCPIEGFEDFLREDFFPVAIEYATTRATWDVMSLEQRIEKDASRTKLHDSFIAVLNSVCRNLGIDDVEAILPDRKTKGDFACYVALFLSLKQR